MTATLMQEAGILHKMDFLLLKSSKVFVLSNKWSDRRQALRAKNKRLNYNYNPRAESDRFLTLAY